LSVVDRTAHTSMVHYDELDLNIEATQLKVSPNKVAPLKPLKQYKAKLRTGVSAKRPQSTKETLIGLAKRNCQVPLLGTHIDFSKRAAKAFAKMKKCFFHGKADAMLASYAKSFVVPAKDTVDYWVGKLDSKVIGKLREGVFGPFLQAYAKYELSLKAQPKPKTEMEAAGQYAATQTILAHRKAVNAVMSPIFIALRDRFLKLLKPNVLVHMMKDRPAIEKFIRKWDFSDGRYVNYVENDFGKFDKSQGWVALRMEWYVYRMLGMDDDLLSMWIDGHVSTEATSIQAGIKILIELQRKSGDATTALGNTIVNMIAVADAYEFGEFLYAMFIGDDSVIALTYRIHASDVSEKMASIYNLDAKTTQSEYGFFCSAFIVKKAGKISFMSDPVKRTEKLGASFTLEEAQFKDSHQSLYDILANYDDAMMNEALSEAVSYRYHLGGKSTRPMIDSLYSVSRDFSAYRSLYEEQESIFAQ